MLRRLQQWSGGTTPCTSTDCQTELTTGVAGWVGASATPSDPHWARVYHGAWIGESNPARSLLVASVSFRISEPSCASFDLAFAADGRVRAAQLNGRALVVPPHNHHATTAQSSSAGLVAVRGRGLFAFGVNSLVLTVANDAGALGFYVAGAVQLLCPLDEATVAMSPASGPADGATRIELRSNVRLYTARWVQCAFGDYAVQATVVDGYTMRCHTPTMQLLHLSTASVPTRGWVDVGLVTSNQGAAAVGVHYKGTRLPPTADGRPPPDPPCARPSPQSALISERSHLGPLSGRTRPASRS